MEHTLFVSMSTMALTLTLFGGPADGRTMAAPTDADFLDFHVLVGRSTGPFTSTHRYWIMRSTSGTHGIGLHAGTVAKDAVDTDLQGA